MECRQKYSLKPILKLFIIIQKTIDPVVAPLQLYIPAGIYVGLINFCGIPIDMAAIQINTIRENFIFFIYQNQLATSPLENPETLTIEIRLSLTTKWIDNQKFSWSIKTGNAWSQRPDFPVYRRTGKCAGNAKIWGRAHQDDSAES